MGVHSPCEGLASRIPAHFNLEVHGPARPSMSRACYYVAFACARLHNVVPVSTLTVVVDLGPLVALLSGRYPRRHSTCGPRCGHQPLRGALQATPLVGILAVFSELRVSHLEPLLQLLHLPSQCIVLLCLRDWHRQRVAQLGPRGWRQLPLEAAAEVAISATAPPAASASGVV